jgi:iron complex transport system permease protein
MKKIDYSNGKAIYHQITYRKKYIIISLIIVVSIFLVANISIGSSSIPVSDIIDILLGHTTESNNDMIIWDIRLPMALMAIVVGAALGISGCEIQTILHNPIASPYTLGITSAASFGAALGIIMEANLLKTPDSMIVTVNAFLFSLLAIGMLYLFSLKRNSDKSTVLLFGVAINFLFNALIMFLQYVADEDDLQSLVFWTFGSLLKTNWTKLIIVTVVLIIGIIILSMCAWKLTAMTLDDTKAQSLGVDVKKTRRIVLITTSLLSAIAVCFVGTIGFVGLIAPHIARIITGEDQRYFMPVSGLLGACILSISFTISKVIIPGVILPVGLVTALIGVPFFMFAIFRKKV